jgi:hypothetical protein
MKDNNEYKTCPDCCYDILDDEGDVMDHECISDNEMIAEFMGVKPTKSELGRKVYHDSHEDKYVGLDLQYDTSWDWLIPVVNKIEEECEGVPIQLLNCNLYSEIGEVYQAVVEFIKQYNESNKMDTLPPSVQQG